MPGMTEDDILATQWMFQYNPDWYDLENSIERRLTEDWVMYRHRDRVRVGQRIYFMRSSAGRGKELRAFTAVGRISTPVYEVPEPRNEQHRYFVDVVYDYLVVPNFKQPEIVADPDIQFSTFPEFVIGREATAFPLPTNIARRTDQVLRSRLQPIGTSHADRRVFLSHSHADNEFALKLHHDLINALGGSGDTVWIDKEDIPGSADWWAEIKVQLKARPVFVVIASPASMTSDWVKDEIDLAWIQQHNAPGGKVIVPVLHRPCELRDELALRQAVSFLPPRPYEDALKELVSTVNQAK